VRRRAWCRRQGDGESLAVEWSRKGKAIIEPIDFSRHLVRGMLSTAVGPRARLSLELKSSHLSRMRMSLKSRPPVVGRRPAAVAD
jgi:hypothetical protein